MTVQATGTITQIPLSPVGSETTGRRNPASSLDSFTRLAEAQSVQKNSSPTSNVDDASAANLTKDELDKYLKKINDFVQIRASNIQFTTDEETGIHIVKVVDTATNEEIRQIPSKEAIQIAKTLDQLQGMLIRQQA
jgi:flagellar protein FlaG